MQIDIIATNNINSYNSKIKTAFNDYSFPFTNKTFLDSVNEVTNLINIMMKIIINPDLDKEKYNNMLNYKFNFDNI